MSLRCVPTHVQMPKKHPEVVPALCGLLNELRLRGLDCGSGSDPIQQNGEARWYYAHSKPARDRKTGRLRYVHYFEHDDHPLTRTPLVVTVWASADFWPDETCTSLAPPRREERREPVPLRLVS